MRTLAFTVAEWESHWRVLNRGVALPKLFLGEDPKTSVWKIDCRWARWKQGDCQKATVTIQMRDDHAFTDP